MTSNFERLREWYRRKTLGEAALTRPVHSLAIVGAGLMGVEIAAANLRHGLRVIMTDTNPQTLAAAPGRIAAELQKYEPRPPECFTPENLRKFLELTTDEDRLAGCDVVLETVVENLSIKQQVYRCLEPRLAAGSILATNTSTIPIGELAAELAVPERFCGIHFCHPVSINPLVEIIPGPQTSAETVSAAVGYARMLGKMPIVVEDGPGFLVNRLLLRYTNEAMHLLLDGAGIYEIDHAATGFGMAMGPLRILDEIGLDTSLSAGRVLLDAFPERIATLPILPLLVKRKHLGQKSGSGFYRYARSAPEMPFEESLGQNPEALAIIEHYAKQHSPPTAESILQRLLLSMVLEATVILREKKRLDPREIDLSMICGLGFPSEQGGLLHWADEIGAAKILKMIEALEPLGPRFQPTPMLRELAKNKGRYYD
jgi:3-hydroxyacyl-CoA dehydrogenase